MPDAIEAIKPLSMEINISLAAYPGLRHPDAAITACEAAKAGVLSEPLFPIISAKHVQLVPQNFGVIDLDLCDFLLKAFSETQFRLHANVCVLKRLVRVDISNFDQHQDWFKQAAIINRHLNAPAYSAHSGYRSEATMHEMLTNAKKISDLFNCPVAVEGQYPTSKNDLLVSTWQEYRELFESGVPYALDLSHINILATQTQHKELTMLSEMLACERCLEIHVSENDGRGDWHQVCETTPWWHPLLKYAHSDAVIFTEGNHRKKRAAAA